MSTEHEKYFELLRKEYQTEQAVCTEIINLSAILNLPKGTEHFMSDLHGDFEAFYHILNSCSGVIKEKIRLLFGNQLTDSEIMELATLIYYPEEKIRLLSKEGRINEGWYKVTLNELIQLARLLSSKYTRSKVRKAMPKDFSYIIDELIHMPKDEDDNQVRYHKKIIDTIIDLNDSDDLIIALASLIKRLAVDHLHIVGDIFDRGPSADKIIDLLIHHHSLDIEWGNHDILWMGAACGSKASVANVLCNNLKYSNTDILEKGYGISLRDLMLFGMKYYPDQGDPIKSALRAIRIISFKLEGQIIKRHPNYGMDDRDMLSRVDWKNFSIEIDGKKYELNTYQFPTIDKNDPLALTAEEDKLISDLTDDFKNSKRLADHVTFLYEKGSMYKKFNGNLIYHGCIPMDSEGNFVGITHGDRIYKGKEYLDLADEIARRAFSQSHNTGFLNENITERHQSDLDFMWFLWGAPLSPLCGRILKTFEREFISDKSTWKEPQDPYYTFYRDKRVCDMILREFGLYGEHTHIINGHTPVKVKEGEQPVRADGRLFVIDGGFTNSMHKTTGLAGYTLIYNSHGLRLKSHQPFGGIESALMENADIESDSKLVDRYEHRILVSDADNGAAIKDKIKDLMALLKWYRGDK
ncbi:MAG: fructose-1,6-bisphosphatase [Lachnospiraceae bacterium]|uniref:Fructose-1,6-bisphosphatase class 3 n=1 Tax=Candidatus Weimeria bifida TaxID=2599074 RepID=A0A6N7J0C7_9FIRM|nr:fructose-1,6-bisphosphatase [Candidatus Weimeria bifida]RRF96805.1 MAG: fructose-1,6-bisphosphatase [Lachnospiraceae bacterium]